MPDESWQSLADERWWRAAPPAPRFHFDRRNRAQRGAATLGVPVVVLSIALFTVTEGPLTGWLGWAWGQGAAVWLAAWPLGTWLARLQAGTTGWRAWKSGGLFAFASAALYVWMFAGGWV